MGDAKQAVNRRALLYARPEIRRAAASPKPWIEAIHAYVPGKSRRPDGRALVKLSANENPLGTSPEALAARARAVTPSLYPDPDSTALARRTGRAAWHRSGADRLRHRIGRTAQPRRQAFAGPGDEVLYVRYGFSLYDIAARRCGATPVDGARCRLRHRCRCAAGAGEREDPRGLPRQSEQPDRQLPAEGEVARLHAGLPPDVLLVLDQAYAEYVAPEDDDGGLALAAAHANVLVTRTFSKIYGLAGERVGWATGAPGLIDALNRIRGPFNVNNARARRAALAALGRPGLRRPFARA